MANGARDRHTPVQPRVRVGVWACIAIGWVAASALFPSHAHAQIGSARYSSIVIDAATGNVITAINPDEPRFPASLTKLMTLYLTFESLRDHRLMLEQLVPVSPHAASMSPSKLGLLPGTRITVEQAIMALVTKSANDAASALGEMLANGDETQFGQMMTLRARALGMLNTVFRNASGLPDPEQVTTARDLALLARHIVQDFPSEYHYFSVPSFVFQRRVIPNHDHLLESYPGADGMKTGYTEASGFNLITSAVRGDVRLIGVVLGAAHPAERDLHMATLLNAGFEQMGIPIEPARAITLAAAAHRLQVFSSAQAATLPPPVMPRAAFLRVSSSARAGQKVTTSRAHAMRSPVSHGRAAVVPVNSRHHGEARAGGRALAG